MTDRKAAAWTWIVGTLLGVPLLYLLSFGPACWWVSRIGRSGEFRAHPTVSTIYQPILSAWWNNRGALSAGIGWYANLLSQRNGTVGVTYEQYQLIFGPDESYGILR